MSLDQVEISSVARITKHVSLVVDGWNSILCTNGEITVARACEIVRDMLAGRPYQIPKHIAGEARFLK